MLLLLLSGSFLSLGTLGTYGANAIWRGRKITLRWGRQERLHGTGVYQVFFRYLLHPEQEELAFHLHHTSAVKAWRRRFSMENSFS
jgi:hypothetical protein